MQKLGPDVVSEEGLRELLGLGYQIVVACSKSPTRKAGVWYGLWHIKCVSIDGQSERILVTFRRDAEAGDKPRGFKTLNGLVGFLHGLGFRTITLPMEEGGRVSHNLPHHGPKTV